MEAQKSPTERPWDKQHIDGIYIKNRYLLLRRNSTSFLTIMG